MKSSNGGGYIQQYTNYPTTVLYFDKVTNAVHPTQKPVPLLEYLIMTYTNEGGIVMDNCMGSGSTGVACVNTGRRFIGMEREPSYYEIATGRIDEAQMAALERTESEPEQLTLLEV